jgi:hypothetical protein
MDASDKGELAEAMTIAECKRLGLTVLEPFGHEQPYDLVVEIGGEFKRLQCKHARYKNGKVKGHLFTAYNDEVRSYEDYEIDYFALYEQRTDEVYIVAVEDAPKDNISLRVEEPEQTSPNIRWADDYVISEVLQ